MFKAYQLSDTNEGKPLYMLAYQYVGMEFYIPKENDLKITPLVILNDLDLAREGAEVLNELLTDTTKLSMILIQMKASLNETGQKTYPQAEELKSIVENVKSDVQT